MSINSETHVSGITEELNRSVSLHGIERYLIHASLNDRRLSIVIWSELPADVMQDTTPCRAHFLNLTHIGPGAVTRVHFYTPRNEKYFFAFFQSSLLLSYTNTLQSFVISMFIISLFEFTLSKILYTVWKS